jgi:hypothetical protein
MLTSGSSLRSGSMLVIFSQQFFDVEISLPQRLGFAKKTTLLSLQHLL